MAVYQCTMFFQQNAYGWTESWFRETTANYDTVLGQLQTLATKRIAICGIDTQITNIRVSDITIFRDVALLALPNVKGAAAQESDAPTTSLLLRCRPGIITSPLKFTYLRGIWDSVVEQGGKYLPSAAFTAAMNSYIAELTARPWGWMGSVLTPPMFINAALPSTGGIWTITVGAPGFLGPFPREAKVRISGTIGARVLWGTKRVLLQSATIFQTNGGLYGSPYLGAGKVVEVTKGFVACNSAQVTRVVERRAGRPGYLSRGRRPARRVG